MTPIRHNGDSRDSLLDAARECILAVGWRRTTLTDVSRRGGVSRMTIYRRWPDMQTLLSDLMAREWSGVVERAALLGETPSPDRLAAVVTGTVGALRANALFRKIVEVDPELLLPYLLDRRGRTQDSMLGLLEAAIAGGQSEETVRGGNPALLARSILLTAHGFALSAPTMTPTTTPATTSAATPATTVPTNGPTAIELDAELGSLIERYLAP